MKCIKYKPGADKQNTRNHKRHRTYGKRGNLNLFAFCDLELHILHWNALIAYAPMPVDINIFVFFCFLFGAPQTIRICIFRTSCFLNIFPLQLLMWLTYGGSPTYICKFNCKYIFFLFCLIHQYLLRIIENRQTIEAKLRLGPPHARRSSTSALHKNCTAAYHIESQDKTNTRA